MDVIQLELIRRRVRLRAYSHGKQLTDSQRALVGKPEAERDLTLLLEEIDRLRAQKR